MASYWPRTIGLYGILCFVSMSRAQGVDKTFENAVGTDVVHAVITKLQACSYFASFSDHHLLRRTAFVETADGTGSLVVPSGGIWALSEEHFNSISSEMAEVINSCNLISSSFSPSDLGYNLLQKFALLSGLAARLYLYHLDVNLGLSIPLAIDVDEQAEYWLEHYTSNAELTKKWFKRMVGTLITKEGCKVNADIFFVLDMSSSISEEDFEGVRDFMSAFVNEITIGPSATQVGAIVYGNEAHVVFNLNMYNSSEDVLNAISKIPFNSIRQGTDTADGLCKLARQGFTAENGSRNSSTTVYRIAILMSDGESNTRSKECDWDTTEAADAIHALIPEVLVYAIGVSDNINENEMRYIATDDSYYTHIQNFKIDSLHETQEKIEDDMCWKATVRYDEGELIDGTLSESQTVRYKLTLPLLGVTIQVCVESGHVVVYGSASYPNPNSALNDFQLVLVCEDCQKEDSCKDVYVPPVVKPGNSSNARSKRSHSSGNETSVYISVVGMAAESKFTMNSTKGDVTVPTSDDNSTGTSSTTTNAPANSSKRDLHKILIIAVSGGVALLILALSCILTLLCCCAVQHKRQQKRKREDEYGLLDVDYVQL